MDSLAKEGCWVREVEFRSVLNKSSLADYAVNGYSGYEHQCYYCYVRFVTRFSHPNPTVGEFC
jgi:DNA repair photolyase